MLDQAALAQGLDVPAKNLPVPGTPSPQIQKLISAPLRPGWNVFPKTDQEWRQVVETGAAATLKTLPGLIDRMKVKVVIVTPDTILPNNRHRAKEAFAEISDFFDKHMAK